MAESKNDLYNFYSLISEYKVEIPVIQRDYAQGRNTPKAKAIRSSMITAMMKALKSDNAEDKLFFDFVYGKIKEIGKDIKILYPFDGQQRLTALFLLHLYFFKKFDPSKIELLKKFSYATRKSSVEFCLKIVTENIMPENEENPISQYIKDSAWFYMDWEKDPTVLSMLAMLDEIHNQFFLYKDLFDTEKIINILTDSDRIQFHFIDMKKYELTDETYIKMNSRGKHLTGFENLKAYLEKYLKEKYPILADDFIGFYDKNTQKQTGIDGIWSDNFFKIQKELNKLHEKRKDLLPDSLIHSFINRYLLNVWNIWYSQDEYDESISYEVNLMNERVKKEFIQFPDNETFVSWDIYEYILDHCDGQKVLSAVFNFFNAITNHLDLIQTNSQPIWDRDFVKWNLFLGDINKNGNEEYSSRIAFFSVVKYFEKNDFDSVKFGDWLRIVWNILENSRTDELDNYNSALQLINGLSEGSNDINKELGTKADSLVINKFAKEQISEEKLKTKKISGEEGTIWKELIEKAEANENLLGRIKLLFPNEEETSKETFQERYTLLTSMMNHPEDEYHFVKVLLSQYKENAVSEPIFFCKDASRHIKNWKKELLTNRLVQCFEGLLEDKIAINSQDWINELTSSAILGSKTRPNKTDKCSKVIWQEGKNVVYWGTNGCAWRMYGNEIDGNVILNNSRNKILKNIPGLKSSCFIEETGYVKNLNVNFIYNTVSFTWLISNNFIYIKQDEIFPERNYDKKNPSISEIERYFCFDASQITSPKEFKKELEKLIKEFNG